MTALPVALAALTLAAWLAIAFTAIYSASRIPRLDEEPPPRPDDPPLPRLSIVVTARNEERYAEQTLRSLLALRYDDYEVIFVNDRSTDRTGEIAERLSTGNERLRVLHVKELPAGWFGKNHAAQSGADAATGEVLLFTDGDVIFAPDAVAYGVRHLVRKGLDHLCASPRLAVSGTMLQACMIAGHLFASATGRLWKVRDPGSSAFFGVGSYTLMRADSYHAIGGHARIALRPDEDVRMGQLVKMSGKRSAFLRGETMVECPWYPSVRALVRGGGKNAFALLDYSIPKVAALRIVLLWLGVAPLVLAPVLWSHEITAGALFAACPLIYWLLAMTVSRDESYPWWSALPFPVAVLIIVFIARRSAVITIFRGVTWGGPPIPWAVLRKARVRVTRPTPPA